MYPLSIYNPLKFNIVLRTYTEEHLSNFDSSSTYVPDYEAKLLELYPLLNLSQVDDLVKEIHEFEYWLGVYHTLDNIN